MPVLPSRRRSALLALLAAVSWAGCATPPVPSPASAAPDRADLAITNVHVVDVRAGEVLRDRTILVSGDRIARVARSGDPVDPPPARTVDGAGAFVIPGLWDLHAHLRADGLPPWITTDWMMPLLVAHGVTGVRDMTSDCDGAEAGPVCLDQMRAWQRQVEAGELLGPRLLALSTWRVNPPWDYEMTEEQARQVVGMFAGQEVDLIKIYHRLSAEGFTWILDEANELGLAAGGHVPLRVTVAEASEAGLRSVEHARDFLFDCFPGSAAFRATATSLDPPLEVMRAMVEEHDPARCREVFRTLVENDTWYVPTHVTRRLDAYADDPEFREDPRRKYVPVPLWEAWQADADRTVALAPASEGRRVMRGFYEKGLEITGAAHRAGVQVLLGTDGGDTYVFPGSSVHDELAELVKAGLSPAEALRAATWKGAEFLGRTDRHGSVEPGKHADLVLLAGNPLESIDHVREIQAVVFRGEYLGRSRLDALLRQAEEAARRPLEP